MSTEGTRLTLIHCLRKLLREKSFDNITISEICDLAHVGRRTFYRYYRDKYDLLRDVTTEYIFHKLDIDDSDDYWTIIEEYCHHLYDERIFYKHAFAVKGQNGFWEEMESMMEPHVKKAFPLEGYSHDMCSFMLSRDIHTVMLFMEDWLNGGCKTGPDTFYKQLRSAFSIHGKWVYQSAMGYPVEAAPETEPTQGEW